MSTENEIPAINVTQHPQLVKWMWAALVLSIKALRRAK